MKNTERLKDLGFKISKELEEVVSKMDDWEQGDFNAKYTKGNIKTLAAKIFIDKDTDIVITQKIKS